MNLTHPLKLLISPSVVKGCLSGCRVLIARKLNCESQRARTAAQEADGVFSGFPLVVIPPPLPLPHSSVKLQDLETADVEVSLCRPRRQIAAAEF